MMPGGWSFVGGSMGLGLGMGGTMLQRRFDEQYHCYSVAYADKAQLEKGDKILLPPSAFDILARLQVDYPMLFKLTNPETGTATHCGVLEFTAEEGCVYIPFWMMQNLLIEEGSLLSVSNASLPKATYVKLQPQSVDFLDKMSNPRAVLEHALRNFSCVTVGDIIQIPYNNQNYHFALKDVQPAPAACIIETDCQVDFDAPVGYVDPVTTSSSRTTQSSSSSQHSSACPSPALMSQQSGVSMSGSMTGSMTGSGSPSEDLLGGELKSSPQSAPSRGVRIVDGKIVRPEDDDDDHHNHPSFQSTTSSLSATACMAERTGGTGVQLNAATVPLAAPPIEYWAVQAGEGARLDGKAAPLYLKDPASGTAVHVRTLRAEAAEAAAQRHRTSQSQSSSSSSFFSSSRITTPSSSSSSSGITLSGKPPVIDVDCDDDHDNDTSLAVPVSKRKTLGGKYSRLKQSGVAFQGSAHSFSK